LEEFDYQSIRKFFAKAIEVAGKNRVGRSEGAVTEVEKRAKGVSSGLGIPPQSNVSQQRVLAPEKPSQRGRSAVKLRSMEDLVIQCR
jgi:hypothetical protein